MAVDEVTSCGSDEVCSTIAAEEVVITSSCEDDATSCDDGEGAYEAEVLDAIFDEGSM